MKKPSYKKLTQALTGLTDKQYRSAYNKFAARVRNYNRIAGTTYDAAREFYFSYRYAGAESPALKGILATPATRAREKGVAIKGGTEAKTRKIVQNVFFEKWAGWFAKAESQQGALKWESESLKIKEWLETGVITYEQADRAMRQLGDARHKEGEKAPAWMY